MEAKQFECTICKKTYKNHKNLYAHSKRMHNTLLRSIGLLLCPVKDCNEKFKSYSDMRHHLSTSHQKKIETEEHVFKTRIDFLRWKESIEKSNKSFYILSSSKCLADGFRKLYYTCHRSGSKFSSKKKPRKRATRFQMCAKIGSHCPSTIDVLEKDSGVHVIFNRTHVGHDMELKDLSLSNLEKSALTKCPSGDVLFNDLLQDVRNNLACETIVPNALKKRITRFLKEAFETEEYDPGLSDVESVHHWVRLCLQEEDSPVLFFKQEDLPDGGEEFLLVIMTEFQKQLLMSSEKTVICVDCVHRRKGRRLYLTCIYIMDECEDAFPVAFCISDKVDASVIKQFLTSVKKSSGPLSYTYFMSDSETFYFDVWKEVMDDDSKWLWSMWYMDYNLQKTLQYYFKEHKDKKAEIYKTMRTLVECHSQNIFETTFQMYLDSLLFDQLQAAKKFGDFLSKKYSPNTKLWSYCYRTGMKLGANFQLDVLHRTLRFCCKEGSKTRLDKFIFVLMKYLKIRLLDRLKNILDDEKIEMALETINVCHQAALDISPQYISSLSDKIWLVKSEDERENVYVIRDFNSCPEYCKLRCSECDICVHMYSCTCIPSMINANLCQHIHAVVWKFLTPYHFSPLPSPALDDNAESDSNDTSPADKGPVLLENVLKMSHSIYKSVVENKSNLNDEALNLIMQKLSEVKLCIDAHSGKETTLNSQCNVQKTSLIPNSVVPLTAPNSVQPLIFQTIQQPNFPGNLSQTLVPNQAQLVYRQGKPLSHQYVIYVPNNMPSN